MAIRIATQQDIPRVHNLGAGVKEFHTSDQAPNFWPLSVLQSCINKRDVYFFVAEVDAEIIGFIIANRNASLSKVLIENIFVAPNARGRGIGAGLVKKVVETAMADRYSFISALVPPDDFAAIKTYQKAGFLKGETFLWMDI